MYGKVLATSGTAYFLTFEHHILPEQLGTAVMVTGGFFVVMDALAGGPQVRLTRFLARVDKWLAVREERSSQRALQRAGLAMERAELERIAQEELEANYGIRMPQDLSDEQRRWVLKHAALAVADYDGTVLPDYDHIT